MGFITYILRTPVRNICGDVAAFYKLNLKVAEARRASRVAYNRIVVNAGMGRRTRTRLLDVCSNFGNGNMIFKCVWISRVSTS